MKTVTREEIEASRGRILSALPRQVRKWMKEMGDEQPFLQVYVAGLLEQAFERTRDADAFANLCMIVWMSMRESLKEPFSQVDGATIERVEGRMMDLVKYAEGEADTNLPRLVQLWMQDYGQRPLMEFCVNALMSEKSPYGVSAQASGLIFLYLKVLIDCLDQAAPAA